MKRFLPDTLRARLARGFGSGIAAGPFSLDQCQAIIDKVLWPAPWIPGYARSQLPRMVHTLNQLSHLPRDTRVLELGAMPFVMSVLLKELLFDHIQVNKLPPRGTDDHRPHEECLSTRQGETQYGFHCEVFDIEGETWPYEDASFGLVLATEVIEHLCHDPMQVFCEANRVLEPRGLLLVTTPNAVGRANALRLLAGQCPSHDPFFRPNPHDRHNREFTPEEIRAMFQAAGFEPVILATVNFARLPAAMPLRHLLLLRAAWAGAMDRRGDFIVALGKKQGPVRERRPTAHRLYQAKPRSPAAVGPGLEPIPCPGPADPRHSRAQDCFMGNFPLLGHHLSLHKRRVW